MKSEILKELLDKGCQAEKELVAGLSDQERNTQGTLEAWTVKDIIAHNSYWRKHHAENTLAVLEGRPIPDPAEDFDHANEEVYYKYRDQSWEEIEALANISRERTKEALTALGDEGLERVDFLPWHEGRPLWRFVVGNVYTHPILHLADWYGKKGETDRMVEMYQAMTDLLADLDNSPDWQGTIRYNLACSYSLAGETEKAISELGEALKMNPALVEWSQQDPDFEPIRDEAGYKALYED
jgi:tetratricopeptide (TPR) repeat protein